MNDYDNTRNTPLIDFERIKARHKQALRRRGKTLVELLAEKYGIVEGACRPGLGTDEDVVRGSRSNNKPR